MKKVLHPSDSRGKADFGWLKANYSFSFANYFNPQRLQFGKLRVLNDDVIDPAKGFGTHPHQNMEIVSIPLSGALAHKDSLNHEEVINVGDIQVMSAGTGVRHSEYNPSNDDKTNLLQIWILPETENVEPRYDQKQTQWQNQVNTLNTLVKPKDKALPNELWLNQQTYFSIGVFEANKTVTYTFNQPENGVYIFVINGSVETAETELNTRDAIGIWDIDKIEIKTASKTSFLVIEVPMN